METLAYLHLALAYETPADVDVGERLDWRKFPSQAWMSVLPIIVALGVLGMASEVLAQTIRLGDRTPQVTFIQERLRQLGYLQQSPTGIFGRATRNAIIRFQRDRGLPPDGIVGSQTEAALFEEFDRRRIPTQQFSYPPQDFSYPPQDFSDPRPTDVVEQRDAVGFDVRELQRRLIERGFDTGLVDGILGRQTRRAIARFQRANGLTVTGTPDSATLEALRIASRVQRNPYVVVVPVRDENTLFEVQRYIPGATTTGSRRGAYVNAGEFPNRNAAESLSYLLRSQGLDARVAHFR
jgi:peptidoglycan hydrolase-like protein with peptidoglycan-binding domain